MAVVTVTALGFPAAAAATWFQPLTHIDSLYPTANTYWPCTNGNSGSDPADTNGFCLTDNANTTWYADSDNSNGNGDIRNQGTINNILENEYEPTALNISHDSTPIFSGPNETDIIYDQGTLPAGVLGQTWCNDAVNGVPNECDQQYARFASHTPASYVICHETGHAVGLTHGVNASPVQANSNEFFFCMRTPLPPVDDRAAVIGSPLGTIGSQLMAHYQNQ